ncbi:conserved repeat domain-containing protein [Paenibacillus sp. OV219]|nr:conserved repeat domain-containing protein [Paenibacillus sp. OV219]
MLVHCKGVSSIALVVRAQFNATGSITFTGNTLGLSRSDTVGVPGTQDSIGAFVTTDTSVRVGTYPFGTTSNYLLNNADAILVIPAGSTVLYAELIWGGTYVVPGVNLSAAINNPVNLKLPNSTTFSVSPDAATANNFDLGSGALGYTRTANVTSQISQGGAGTYNVGAVVGTATVTDPTANHAGWTLAVIYGNPTLPFRNMSLRVGAVLIQSTSAPVVTTITGFATPTSGALSGRALFSGQEGDANRTGDQALFGPSSGTQVALSGTNNFANNFFASQINNDSGALNTTGTFGTRNQTNGAPGTNIIGGRQGWDITNVDVSARLINNQSSAVLTLTTSGDAYVVNANALQININAPVVSLTKSANVAGTVINDQVTYTVTVNNTGTANASNVVVTDALPAGSAFVAGSVVLAGVAKPTFDITAGVPIGTLALNSSVTLTYKARITSLPSPPTVNNTANAAFTFQSVAGGDTITGVIPSNTVSTPVYSPVLNLIKSANTSNAAIGTTVTYTILVNNSGSIGATTTLTDNIPTGSTLVPNSVTVNSVTQPVANPAVGFPIGTVAVGTTTTVTFQVVVNSLPSPPQLTDQATSTYTYSPPDGRVLSGSAASNTLTIPVSVPNVTASKSSNRTATTVGDTITFSTVVANSGVAPVTNVVFNDPIPTGTSFVAGSVTVGGTPVTGANPASGISLGTINNGTSVTVAFQLLVTSLPNPAQITNRASISYNSGTFNGISLSNTINVPVYQPIISASKSANFTQATVGDTITYTFSIPNTGNINAQLTLTDSLPAGTTYVANSITVNGSPRPGATPQTGIPVGTVAAGATVTVIFQVLLQTLPNPPSLSNQATFAYTYTLPDSRVMNGSGSSNRVTIPASAPNVNVSKSISEPEAAVGDEITYTIVVTNNGIEAVSQVIVSDPIPVGTIFESGSVLIGGVPAPSANPASGVAVGSIAAGASKTVSFKVIAVSLPTPAQFSNRAAVSFTSGAFTGSSFSNTITIPVYQPIISITKSANTSAATLGDLVVYTLQVSNNGNIAANMTLSDNIPSGCSFVANSVILNGVPQPGSDPSAGFPIFTVPPFGISTVTFEVSVDTLPSPQQLVNSASGTYTYTLPGGRILNGEVSSNTVSIPVSAPNLSVVLSTTAPDVITGDTITYTGVVTNNGITNVNNVIFVGPSIPGTTFVAGSVTVNGVAVPQADATAGIPIGALGPGAFATVTYEVKLIMPVSDQIVNQSTVSFTSGSFSSTSSSNVVTTPVTQPEISVIKTANTSNAQVGDTVTFTIAVSNTGNLPASVIVTDTIPPSSTYVQNSVIVNGLPQPSSTPTGGIDAGTVNPGGTSYVMFSVVIDTLPNPQQLVNQATATYTFTPPDGRTITLSKLSNTLSISVSSPNVTVGKSSTQTAVSIGDIIPYTILVSNNGIAPVTNTVFIDGIPSGTQLVAGSVTVNGVVVPNANPAAGVTIGTVPNGTTATVTFSLLVTSVPTPAFISNQASVSYTSGAFSSSSFSNGVDIPVYQPVISVVKSANTTNATVGLMVAYTLAVTNSGNYAAAVTLTDTTLAPQLSFVPNSVIVGGQPQAGSDPATGIPVGVVFPNTTVNVTFSAIITSLPPSQQLTNQATAAFSYTLPDNRTLSGSVLSNSLTYAVSAPDVDVVKSATLTASTIGDTQVYSITVMNSGIAPVDNVIFSDPIPAGTSFVSGSITVDGVPRPDANPAAGFSLGSIGAGVTVTVTFSVTITSVPNEQLVSNRSSVSFTSGIFSAVTFSNTVTTPVYQPVINLEKSSSTVTGSVGSTINYNIVTTNSGNYPAVVTISDPIPAGTSFVPNTVVVNGLPQAGADPTAGFSIGTVAAGASVTATFTLLINTLPPNQQLTNQATANYIFTLPDNRSFARTSLSNTLNVPVTSPNISLVKSTVATDAVIGDNVTYSILVTNTSIANLNSAVLTDTVPVGTTFVPGSVVVGGVPRPGADPALGITLGSITPSNSVTVTFVVTVNTLPVSGLISNQALVSFTSGAFSGTGSSNIVTTPVYNPIIAVLKTANTANATVGDTITYSMDVTNTGNLAATVTLFDQIPTGADFVPNSVTVGGVPQPGADPTTGINVGVVAAGATVHVLVTLNVTVDALPSPQQLVNTATANYSFSPPDGRLLSGTVQSNTVVIPVSSPNVSVVKSSNAIDAVVGDTITYTITATNNGISPVNNVTLVDPIPAGASFIAGSVTVNGSPRTADSPNTGIQIGTIAAGAVATVTFQVLVV